MMLNDGKTCYTCLQSTSKELIDASNMDHDKVTYLEKLEFCIATNLVQGKVKMKFCFSCIQKLRTSYLFKTMVLDSQNTLKQLCNNEYKSEIKGLIEIKKSFIEDNDSDSDYFLADLKNADYECKEFNSNFNINILPDQKLKNLNSDYLNMNEIKAESICQTCGNNYQFDIDKGYLCKSCDTNISNEVNGIDNNNKKKQNTKKYHVKSKPLIEHFCDVCGSVFDKQWKLRKHRTRVHVLNKSHVCNFCNRAFKQSYHLREHLTSHTGEKNYMCNYCEKSFQRVSSLKRHIRSHEAAPGQKTKRTPFLCSVCGKSFPFSNGVQRHMRIHLGIRNHQCIVCKKRFTQSTHLHVHMRTHTGEKPFICDLCGEAFSLNAGLQKHKNLHEKIDLKESKDEEIVKYDLGI